MNWGMQICGFNFRGDVDNLDNLDTFLINQNTTSLRCMNHLGQLISAEEPVFRKFDFGEKENMTRYGTEKVVDYDLGRICGVEIVNVIGTRDELGTKENCETLMEEFEKIGKGGKGMRAVYLEDWGHLSFVIPKRPRELFDVVDREFD